MLHQQLAARIAVHSKWLIDDAHAAAAKLAMQATVFD